MSTTPEPPSSRFAQRARRAADGAQTVTCVSCLAALALLLADHLFELALNFSVVTAVLVATSVATLVLGVAAEVAEDRSRS